MLRNPLETPRPAFSGLSWPSPKANPVFKTGLGCDGITLLAIDNIDVEATLKTVQQLLAEETHLSPALRSILEVMNSSGQDHGEPIEPNPDIA